MSEESTKVERLKSALLLEIATYLSGACIRSTVEAIRNENAGAEWQIVDEALLQITRTVNTAIRALQSEYDQKGGE